MRCTAWRYLWLKQHDIACLTSSVPAVDAGLCACSMSKGQDRAEAPASSAVVSNSGCRLYEHYAIRHRFKAGDEYSNASL